MTKATLNRYVSELQTILNKDYDHETPDKPRSREFTKVYRKMIAAIIKGKGWELVKDNSVNWCSVSGFIKNENNKYVYFSISDYRCFLNEWKNNVLIRIAENERDFHGAGNNYTSLENFVENLERLFARCL